MPFVPDIHDQNRAKFPATELAKYYGKEVAWNLDGTQILASGADPKDVCAAVSKAGIRSDEVVLAYVPYPDEVLLGGAWMADGDGQ